jgi:hypothetical protein
MNDKYAIKIQKVFKGYIVRSRRLPLILYIIQNYLKSHNFTCSDIFEDGRNNSSVDEIQIIKILVDKFKSKIIVPKVRLWYDILIYDKIYDWIPVNIKTTKMSSRDNTGNLAMCVHAYTNFKLVLNYKKSYSNGLMSSILINKLKNKEYNNNYKKDYYFIVLNKTDPKDIVINSILGLNKINTNINNLPFQVCWNINRIYKRDMISNKIDLFINCITNYKNNWKSNFLTNIKSLKRKTISSPIKNNFSPPRKKIKI